jgi:UDP-N-acetylmuramoylalanine--D-glutamate ligase
VGSETAVTRGAAPWPLGALGLPCREQRPRVAVLGLARSGLAAARLLLERGCLPDLLDLREPEGGAAALRDLAARGARLRIGPHDPAWLGDFDLLIKSPGIPAEAAFVREAARAGVPVVGELELAFLAARGPVIAITGTNGKSTTTAWTGDILRTAGIRAQVAGNIGRAFSEAVLDDPDAVFVVEVSSFQLEDVRTFRPKAGCLLNLTPDHLDRHGSMDWYRDLKLRLFRHQKEDDFAFFGSDEALARYARPRLRSRWGRFVCTDLGEEGSFLRDDDLWLRFGKRELRLLSRSALSIPGPHNLENALAASACAFALGAEVPEIARSLASFRGLPHRLEPVGEIQGVRFVNDSKATNTDSLAVALRSFDRPVILIAGGRDKGQDFRPLRDTVEHATDLVLLIGEATSVLERDWEGVRMQRAASLEEAVEAALRRAGAGQVVLLSPACASFDMFRNYEDRGDRFREIVRRLERRVAGEQEDGEGAGREAGVRGSGEESGDA